jgi:hypothetical protein
VDDPAGNRALTSAEAAPSATPGASSPTGSTRRSSSSGTASRRSSSRVASRARPILRFRPKASPRPASSGPRLARPAAPPALPLTPAAPLEIVHSRSPGRRDGRRDRGGDGRSGGARRGCPRPPRSRLHRDRPGRVGGAPPSEIETRWGDIPRDVAAAAARGVGPGSARRCRTSRRGCGPRSAGPWRASLPRERRGRSTGRRSRATAPRPERSPTAARGR